MAVTFLFSAVAAIAFIPVGVFLFLILDRYAEPNVAKSLFDERKVTLTFIIGLVLGLVLAVIFVSYAFYLNQLYVDPSDIGGASLLALVFLLVAAFLRRAVFHTRRFGGLGGTGGKDPLVPVYMLSYGAMSGATVSLGLGLDIFAGSASQTPSTFVLLAFLSCDMIVVEGWAGMRFGRAMLKGASWIPPIPVVLGEAGALAGVGTMFLGLQLYALVPMGIVLLAGVTAVFREEPKALKGLRRALGIEKQQRTTRFGRGEAPPGAAGLPEGPSTSEPLPSTVPPTESASPLKEEEGEAEVPLR